MAFLRSVFFATVMDSHLYAVLFHFFQYVCGAQGRTCDGTGFELHWEGMHGGRNECWQSDPPRPGVMNAHCS